MEPLSRSRTDYILNYAERELKLAKLPIVSSTLIFLKDLCNLTTCDPRSMLRFTHVLQNLIEMKPITPITEDDFEPQETRHVCTRRSTVYRANDGKYYDDRAVVYHVKNRPDLGSMYIYQGTRSSKREITLPYIVNPQIVELSEEDAGIRVP